MCKLACACLGAVLDSAPAERAADTSHRAALSSCSAAGACHCQHTGPRRPQLPHQKVPSVTHCHPSFGPSAACQFAFQTATSTCVCVALKPPVKDVPRKSPAKPMRPAEPMCVFATTFIRRRISSCEATATSHVSCYLAAPGLLRNAIALPFFCSRHRDGSDVSSSR